MEFTTHQSGGKTICEARGEAILIASPQDALDLMVNSGARKIVVQASQLHPDFFDLSTRLAGEVLQKFTNYHVQLGIVGDFSRYPSRSLRTSSGRATGGPRSFSPPALGRRWSGCRATETGGLSAARSSPASVQHLRGG